MWVGGWGGVLCELASLILLAKEAVERAQRMYLCLQNVVVAASICAWLGPSGGS